MCIFSPTNTLITASFPRVSRSLFIRNSYPTLKLDRSKTIVVVVVVMHMDEGHVREIRKKVKIDQTKKKKGREKVS